MRISVFLAILIWLIAAANFFVVLYDLDSPGVGLDDLLHFAGGLWLAGLLIYLFRKFGISLVIGNWILVIAIVLAIGIFWELGEFIIDVYFEDKLETLHDGNLDTGLDLFFDLLGATIFLLWQRRLLLKAAKS